MRLTGHFVIPSLRHSSISAVYPLVSPLFQHSIFPLVHHYFILVVDQPASLSFRHFLVHKSVIFSLWVSISPLFHHPIFLLVRRTFIPVVYQSIISSSYPSVILSIRMSVRISGCRPVCQPSFWHSISLATIHPVNRSVGRSIPHLLIRLVGQSITYPVNRLVGRSIRHYFNRPVGRSIRHPVNRQSVGQRAPWTAWCRARRAGCARAALRTRGSRRPTAPPSAGNGEL